MNEKRKLFLTSIFALIASTLALTSFTFAWMKQDQALANVLTLTSGDSEAKIEAHVYERRYATNGSTPVEVAYYVDDTNYVNAVRSTTGGVISVAFAKTALTNYDLTTAYNDEYTVNAKALPSYYVELRVLKQNLSGYLAANMTFGYIPTAAVGELDFSSVYPFDYRYIRVANSETTPMISAIPSQISTLESTASSRFFNTSAIRTSGITLFDASDLIGSPILGQSGYINQCFIEGFSTQVDNNSVFAKSILLEFYIDPAILAAYIRSNLASTNSNLSYGIDFKINVQYSNNPIKA